LSFGVTIPLGGVPVVAPAETSAVQVAWSDPRPADDADPIALLTESLADKDDTIQSQYAEIVSLRHRLELAVRMLNEAQGKAA
jgi:hypothetical protein